MKKKGLSVLVLCAGFTLGVHAQYPQMTAEASHLIDSLQARWTAHSDSAWQAAFPIVLKEAMEGRPYVPWAARPYDLRQAKIPAFPVDTHIHRLAMRWGLSDGSSVEQTEKDLKKVFPESEWEKRHLQIIYFGRTYCKAMGHKPENCPICKVVGCK